MAGKTKKGDRWGGVSRDRGRKDKAEELQVG